LKVRLLRAHHGVLQGIDGFFGGDQK